MSDKNIFKVEAVVGERTLSIETGKMAKQADGACVVAYGDTVVLVTVVATCKENENCDFFPLFVDYREKTSAAGKFPGGYIKREGRPTEKEILTCRLTDRPIRPLFPEGYFHDVQVLCSVLSADEENDPDILAIIGASAALSISDIPFAGPVGAIRVGLKDGQFLVNPTYEQLKESDLDLVVAGSKDAVLMVEGQACELTEKQMLDAIFFAHEKIQEVIQLQVSLSQKSGTPKKEVSLEIIPVDIITKIETIVAGKLEAALVTSGKKNRAENVNELFCKAKKVLVEEDPELTDIVLKRAFEAIEKKTVRQIIRNKKTRIDGRKPDEIRPINGEVGLMPRTHGSSLFTRGETQALAITTLGTTADAQRMEGFEGEKSKQFMLHYNFPPFSVGETRPIRGPGRREIGHGMLAERALAPVLPKEDFPYTIRVVSDILESNGSSSMATVCGGCLSMMDAGVPITSPVAGIAMGLIKEDDAVVILSDILGDEDHYGDMDFKVAGTNEGVTAIQMDMKIAGIDKPIIEKALLQAKEGRLYIMKRMSEVLQAPRENISSFAPKIYSMQIDKEKIGALIGPGGKNIKKIIEETGAEINIEDTGIVMISSSNEATLQMAIEKIKLFVEDPEPGKIYKGIVKSVMDFGAFVEILPGKEGLVHISQFEDFRIEKVADVVKVGDEILVKLLGIDERGRLSLSKKQAILEANEKDSG
ncbi:polyribonucleotide nucleotidyltransferase [Chlamydiota bacterium]